MIEIRGWLGETEAQAMADETGRVTYLGTHPLRAAKLTTDRELAIQWPQMVAFVPKQCQQARLVQAMAEEPAPTTTAERMANANVLGGNLGVLASRVLGLGEFDE
jgi:predicted Zn-dependent protease